MKKSVPKRAQNKFLAFVYFALRFSVVGVLIAQVFNRDFESVFLCVLTLILFLIPSFFERRLHIDVPDTLEIIILLFIYAAEILGEIRLLHNLSLLGHHAPHLEWFSLCSSRLFPGRHPEPEHQAVHLLPVPGLYGPGSFLLLYDGGGTVGVF